MDVKIAVSKCEDITDTVLRKTKKILPYIGRLFLISTFVEDGIRLLFNTSDHADYFTNGWGINYNFAYFLTFSMGATLLVCSLLVMLRIKVPVTCGLLASVLFAQIVLYRLYTTYYILSQNVSVLAAILLLFTENELRKPTRSFNQLPQSENEVEATSVMLCACRLFLNLMLLSIIQFDLSYKRLFLSIISYGMIFCMWCGYKTRMVSLLLATWLFVYNVIANDFWNKNFELHIIRYDFFQALSAVGGLLLLIHTGPGELSFDEMKKKW
ncbi:unnamed protein product [Caenorhabditis sp. 36 PRJEB53466]|nr:unnamed protein product [Caenorhabditis sp. 36 PRJEB53466]